MKQTIIVVILVLCMNCAASAFQFTITEEAQLHASDASALNEFGSSVAIDPVEGNTIVVGSPKKSFSRGAAYIFERSGSTWSQSAKLTASDSAANDFLGVSVDIYGDVVVVGAFNDSAGAGSVYVYEKPMGGWSDMTETAKMVASDQAGGDFLGERVSLWGDVCVAGARRDDRTANDMGAAYVFVRPVSGWTSGTETAKLTASDAAGDDEFGSDVSIHEDIIGIGAFLEDGPLFNRGAAYLFVKPESGWESGTETAKLTASDAADGDTFAGIGGLRGDFVVIGANRDDESFIDQGSAYVFERPVGGWVDMTETAKLTASDASHTDFFGSSAVLIGNGLIIAAYNHGNSGPDIFDGSGSLYLYVRPDDGWQTSTETTSFNAADTQMEDLFGFDIDATGDTLVVGSRFDSDSFLRQGAAYVFTICPCLGNVNLDDRVDARDVQWFVDCLLEPGSGCACADLVLPTDIGSEDVAPFVAKLLNDRGCTPMR